MMQKYADLMLLTTKYKYSLYNEHVNLTHLMRLWHRHAFLHQELDNFIVVGVCSEDNRCDVRGEVRELLVQ